MNTVSTIQQLKASLTGDGQESGTQQGWVIFEGQKLFVRRHWSYSGGYPVYRDADMQHSVGELQVKPGTATHYHLNGEPQYRHGVKDWPVYDHAIALIHG